MKRRFVIIVLSLFSITANAALNKWVDADGSVHYSDTVPPEVVQAKKVLNMSGKGQTEALANHSPKSLAVREAELKKSKQEKEEASKKKTEEDAKLDEKKHNCATAQENLRTLEEGTRILTIDANGERSYLDNAAREQRLNEAHKAISANCN